MLRQRIVDWLVYLLVRLFICVVQALRMETCHAVARGLAVLACDVLRLRRSVTDENLQQVFPDWSEARRRLLTRRMWEHWLLMVCEVAHAPRKLRTTTWSRYIQVDDKARMVRTMLEPRPLVLVTGHYGNFELAGFIAGLYGFPTYTVARPIDNPYLNRFINRFRGANGQHILPKQGSAAQAQAVLDAGGVFSLLGDQHGGKKGCWVDFLGRPASCHKAIALFPLLHGAPLVVTYTRRIGNQPFRFELGIRGIVDPANLQPELAGVKPLTQWYNQRLEELILETPEQYWWLHRRWKGSPGRRKKRPQAARAATAADADPQEHDARELGGAQTSTPAEPRAA